MFFLYKLFCDFFEKCFFELYSQLGNTTTHNSSIQLHKSHDKTLSYTSNRRLNSNRTTFTRQLSWKRLAQQLLNFEKTGRNFATTRISHRGRPLEQGKTSKRQQGPSVRQRDRSKIAVAVHVSKSCSDLALIIWQRQKLKPTHHQPWRRHLACQQTKTNDNKWHLANDRFQLKYKSLLLWSMWRLITVMHM